MASATLLKPDAVKVENEIDSNEMEPLTKKEERSSSVPHIAKTDRKKIQRSQTEGAKHQKSEDSTTGKKTDKSSTGKKRQKKPRAKSNIIPDISCSSLLFALLVRVMFSLHAGIAFYRVTAILNDSLTKAPMKMEKWVPFLNLCGIALLFIETFITLLYRGGKEYKWFCPCVFFYLISIIPSLLMLEYDIYYKYVDDNPDSCQQLSSQPLFHGDRRRRDINDTYTTTEMMNFTEPIELIVSTTALTTTVMTTKSTPDSGGGINIDDIINGGADFGDKILNMGGNVIDDATNKLNQISNPEDWVLGLHQVLLFFLVIGRWMLPRGGISREQLSQLLLVFIGTGADILEFVSETIDSDSDSACSLRLHAVIWIVWAWSLFQFTLVLTASSGRKARGGGGGRGTNSAGCCTSCCMGYFSNPDVWGMLLTLFLQDLPFLVARCYFIFELNMRSQMMIFFTLKNLLVVLLQVYRLGVLWVVTSKELQSPSAAATRHDEKREAILNEVMPLINQNGNDPTKIRANVIDKKSDGSVIVQLTPSLNRKPKDRKNKLNDL